MTIFTRFTVTRSSRSLWRVTFDNPPINLIDAVMMKELLNLLTEIERDKRVGVVLFDSADPDFFLATTTSRATPPNSKVSRPRRAGTPLRSSTSG